jgi:peptidoglycan/LPS O-acetylase OafA/YrhL
MSTLTETHRSLEATAPAAYRGHILELDAIRAIGIFIVLVNHSWPREVSNVIFRLGEMGWIAMDAFFVLSGFLITGILLDTRSRPDYFRNYYTRRSLRIFPLYYLVLAAIVVMALLSRGGNGSEYSHLVRTWGSPGWFAVYLGNFKMAVSGDRPPVLALAPLWSLQVEEQFYLLFPFAIRWMRREHLSRMLWCMVILSPLFRVAFYLYNPSNTAPEYVLLPCHMEGLALGALIAIRFRSGPWNLSKGRLTVYTITMLAITCIAPILASPRKLDIGWYSTFNRLAGYSLSSFACAGLVLWLIQFRGSTYTRALRIAPIQYLAKISYGIYLLHEMASRCMRWLESRTGYFPPDGLLRFFSIVALSILFASISWYFFEGPLVRLKDRLAPSHPPDRTAVQV